MYWIIGHLYAMLYVKYLSQWTMIGHIDSNINPFIRVFTSISFVILTRYVLYKYYFHHFYTPDILHINYMEEENKV